MNINKKYQGGGLNKKRMGNNYMGTSLPNPEPLIPEVGNKGDTVLKKMNYGGKMKYGHGGKNNMMFLDDGGNVPLRGFDGEEVNTKPEMKMQKPRMKMVKEEFDPGVDRESTEEAGNPTKSLTTKNPSGGKWLGDERPPMYGASEEHVPFLTTVYEMMDAGEDMDQMYHSQKYLRPYINYIMAGQNESVLPSLENAEGAKTGETTPEPDKPDNKGKMPAFMKNMSKDDIMEVLKNMPGRKI